VNPLGRRLAERIRAAGSISIAEFMEAALLDPELGYYTTRDPLGARGDFITAPEVSQIFGELIGLWCADTWEKMGRPTPVILAELGPGRGTLMADALRALKIAPAFRRAARLHLVERSPALRRSQAERLAEASPRWHDAPAELPPGPLILIANEFLDALPIRQFRRGAAGWEERRVVLAPKGDSLAFRFLPASAAPMLPPGLCAEPGSLCEIREAASALAAELCARLAREGGTALFIDYGYFPSACGDTLQALRAHRRHEVLDAPGSADITAHVDFAGFAAAASAAGAAVWGPVAQGAFLTALGLAERAGALLRRASPAQANAIESGCRRLIDPGEMGTLFKVLALADASLPAPAGFAGKTVV
jgi:NADH dehydrogenase [ubiquinone] 1 alpha subcomplex assembly factor 7